LINVNLISERERARRIGELAGRVAFFIAVLAFAGAIGSFTLQQGKVGRLRRDMTGLQTQVDQYSDSKSEIDSLQHQLDGKRPVIDLLRSAQGSERKWCLALVDIQSALPPTVQLTAIRSSKNIRPRILDVTEKNRRIPDREGFTIQGFAPSNELVGEYMTNLQSKDTFADVSTNFSRRRSGANTYDFEMLALMPERKKQPAGGGSS